MGSEPATVARFFEACANGDIEMLRELVVSEPGLVRLGNPAGRYRGWTGLHSAAQAGQRDAVRLLIDAGADPNARESGDNTYPLHWAAARGDADIVRALLDAGGDVHGLGDVHELDAIGWATFYQHPGGPSKDAVVRLLLERGAHHHIFSAMSVGDADLIRKLVADHPDALNRRMSRFEQGLAPLHFALSRKRYDLLDLLIELGADLEAKDDSGQTALAVAMMQGDHEAMRRLHAAGATPPETARVSDFTERMSAMAGAIKKGVPMMMVPDVGKALDWYKSIGFTEHERYDGDGVVNFGYLSFGGAELMLNMHGKPGPHDVSYWFYTDKIDDIYRLLKSRQLEAAQAALTGAPGADQGITFEEDIADMFYGARQFGIRDLNGYILYFIQSTR